MSECTVTDDGVRFRAAPGLSAEILQELSAGTMVERRDGAVVNLDGYRWQPVRFAGRNGYIAATYLDCDSVSGDRIITRFGRAPLDLSVGIRASFPPTEHVRAAEVAHCESSWNTMAFNPSGERSRGYFQINGVAHPQWDNSSMFDPAQNCRAAGELFRQSGWQPWSCARVLGFFVDTARATDDVPDADRSGEYVFPVQGWTGRTVPLHWGTHPGASDLFAPKHTPVVAMRGGEVVDVGTAATDPFGGNNVLIEGDDGLTYYYAHGDRVPEVDRGTTIGTGTFLFGVNESGNAQGTGDHLHIGIGHGIQDGVGPAGGAGINFNAVELLQRVLDGAQPTPRPGRTGQYIVRGTGHLGLRLRAHPSHSAQILATLREDDVVDGEETIVEAEGRTWRRLRNPAGWAANEFLVRV